MLLFEVKPPEEMVIYICQIISFGNTRTSAVGQLFENPPRYNLSHFQKIVEKS